MSYTEVRIDEWSIVGLVPRDHQSSVWSFAFSIRRLLHLHNIEKYIAEYNFTDIIGVAPAKEHFLLLCVRPDEIRLQTP